MLNHFKKNILTLSLILTFSFGFLNQKADALGPLALLCVGGGCKAVTAATGGALVSGVIWVKREMLRDGLKSLTNLLTTSSNTKNSQLYKMTISGNVATADSIEEVLIQGLTKTLEKCKVELISFRNLAGYGTPLKQALNKHPDVTIITMNSFDLDSAVLQASARGKCLPSSY